MIDHVVVCEKLFAGKPLLEAQSPIEAAMLELQSRLAAINIPADASAPPPLPARQQEPELALGQMIKHHDRETGGHIKRMGYYSAFLYQKCGHDAYASECLRLAAMLHDIGKIYTPAIILKKPGRLTHAEWKVMREHPEQGYEILRDSCSPILELGALIALTHHEKWDGSGYPLGLQGQQIPLVGRIVALADVFDALVSQRCYKQAWSIKRSLGVIVQGRGKHFDPALVDLFLEHFDELLLSQGAHRD